MSSLVAILMLAILALGGVAFSVRRYAQGGRRGARFIDAPLPLVALFGVLVAYVTAWVIAVALARR